MTLHNMLVTSYRKCQRTVAKAKAISSAKRIASEPSYFPEKKRKDYKVRLRENLEWAYKFGEANEFYTLYGFDIEENALDQTQYIDYLSFRNSREKVNRVGKDDAQVVLLRDKLLFYIYMKNHNLPVPEVFAYIRNGKLFNLDFVEIPFEKLRNERDYFLKDQGGECASYVKHINDFDQLQSLRKDLFNGSFILQRRVVQNEEMNILNPYAINTLRIITVNNNGQCYVLTSLLRVGTEKTGNVDNWAAGGLAVGIDSNGYLKEFGFYKPVHGLKESIHPDTGIKFTDFKVPQYENACRIACEAHKAFFNVRAIGWDIAITKEGPVFIEGNDNFEISLQQACDRPLRKEWAEVIKD